MIRLKVLSSSFFDECAKKLQDTALQSMTATVEATKAVWAQEAKARLNTTANAYISSIYGKVTSDSSGVYAEMGLNSKWANMLEDGFPAFDMKSSFSNSTKRKVDEDGHWYLRIPFRHYTPQAKKTTSMPNAIYNQARKMPQWGRIATSDTKSVYNGMTKVPQGNNKSTYMTWRTVAESSPASTWMHPGFSGVHVGRSLQTHLEDTLTNVFNASQQSW